MTDKNHQFANHRYRQAAKVLGKKVEKNSEATAIVCINPPQSLETHASANTHFIQLVAWKASVNSKLQCNVFSVTIQIIMYLNSSTEFTTGAFWT